MLLHNALRLSPRVDAQDIFSVIPQQVGGNVDSSFYSLGNQERSGAFLLSVRSARILDLHELPFVIEDDHKGDFFQFEALGGKRRLWIICFAFVVACQFLKDHPRTSSLSHAGILTTPSVIRA